MLKELKKESIPDWKFGDVSIKTYSWKDAMKIAEMTSSINLVNGEMQVVQKESINLYELNMISLASGINFIRTFDGGDFIVKPGMITEEKVKGLENPDLSQTAAMFLLNEVSSLNKPLSVEEKKN